jgi:hypothetical protein
VRCRETLLKATAGYAWPESTEGSKGNPADSGIVPFDMLPAATQDEFRRSIRLVDLLHSVWNRQSQLPQARLDAIMLESSEVGREARYSPRRMDEGVHA